ncbi:MAG TPA: hypothetical protein VGH49_05345 [Xanthobacteraceae bacterium]|jgi:hypothetical protein
MKRVEGKGGLPRIVVAAGAVLAALASDPASAQAQQSRSIMPGAQQFAPSGGAGAIGSGQTLIQPGASIQPGTAPAAVPSGPPLAAPSAAIPAGQVGLVVSARYGRDFPQPINSNLVWRVYPVKPDQGGAFRPIKEEKTATPTFVLAPGDYVVHVTFGLASATKAVHLKSDVTREVFEIPAGGLRMEGRVGDARIPPGQISFDVFRGSQFEPGEKRPVAPGIVTGDVVVLPEGTYHIVSNYGDSNSVVRSDIRVAAGKLTDVTVTHRAAVIMLKLVSERGGEALANTNWSVLTPGGDVIKESIGAFPKVTLAEGDYRAIARNDGKTYEREFKVITGVDGEIEVLAH